MGRKVISVWLVVLLLLGVLVVIDVSIDITPRVGATTWYVDDVPGGSPSEDFTSIQAAIDNASDGDTIYVYSGIYYENISTYDKSLILTGQNRDTTIIDGQVGISTGAGDSFTIEKFTVKNGNYGIFAYGPNILVFYNKITNCTTGILVEGEDTIHSNTINYCDVGIEIGIVGNNFVYNNIINTNVIGLKFQRGYYHFIRNYIAQNNTVNGETIYHFYNVHGTPGNPIILENLVLDTPNISNSGKINLVDCSNFLITNNLLSNNYGSGIMIISSENITISENDVINNTLGVGEGDGGIIISNAKNITVKKNSILNNCGWLASGIDACSIDGDSNSIFIINNNISGNNAGINCEGDYIYINDNRVANNSGEGIDIQNSLNQINLFGEVNNNIVVNNKWGISFSGSSPSENSRYFNVTNNTLIGNWVGMTFSVAWNLTVKDNRILSCNKTGLRSAYYSHYNIFSNNTIESDQYGLVFDRESDNTFINNTINGSLYDIYFQSGYTSWVTLLNCSFNKSKVYYSWPESTLTVQWYLHINVTDALGNPIPNANVCIKDSQNSLPAQKYKTGSEGYVRWLIETEYIEQDIDGDTKGEKTYHTPHKITAWNESLMGYADVNMNESKEVNVVLDTPYYEIPLYKGWNLVSLPLVQSDTSISTVLSSIAGNYDKVEWYNASERLWHTTDDDLTDLDHTMGFWIHMKTDDILVVTGDIPNTTSIQLYQGWNLVGNPFFCIHEFDEIFASIIGNYTAVQWFDAGDKGDPWKHYQIDKPQELNDLKYITCGRGYWIYVEQDCVWEVSNF